MVFSSLIFVFAFLPIQLLVYYITPNKYKNAILLLFSLIFYGWSGPGYLLILAGEAFVSYLCAKKNNKIYLIINCVILLSVLIFFKYLSFGAECLNGILGLCGVSLLLSVPKLLLPLGISFYTFQLISYVVDVYLGNTKANDSYFKVLLYAGLFHQCIAGPIVRYETVANEIENRAVNINDIYSGVLRFSIGLFKKAVLANSCASVADILIPMSKEALMAQSTIGMWLGAVFYMLQIYLDFSAYSDMAIGMGRMIGFHYLENFNYPYIANSVTEFWRRWHISLSSFFRDYVYIPLGGNRVKLFRHIANLFVVWFLTGLWHGASGNFIIWGLYYFAFLILEKFVISKIIEKCNKNSEKKILNIFINCARHIVTLIIVLIGWVIFRFDSMELLGIAFSNMFNFSSHILLDLNTKTELMNNVFLLAVCAIACTPAIRNIYRKMKNMDKVPVTIIINAAEVIMPVLLILLATIALAGNSYNPFIYYRF